MHIAMHNPSDGIAARRHSQLLTVDKSGSDSTTEIVNGFILITGFISLFLGKGTTWIFGFVSTFRIQGLLLKKT